MIKLIALDLDGTTLNSEGKLHPETKAILEKTISEGVEVVIATGRVLSALPDEVLGIKGLNYAITSNGAKLFNLKSGQPIYTNMMSESVVEKVIALLRKYDFMAEVFINDMAYIEETIYKEVEQNGSPFNNTSYLLSTRKPVDDIFEYILNNKKLIENINLNFVHPEERDMMRDVLSKIDDIAVTSSFYYNLEICGGSTNKADALMQLCKKLSIPSEYVMTCGDSHNDIEMLKYSKFSVAVVNANESVKKVAKYITTSNDENGVSEAIKKLVLHA